MSQTDVLHCRWCDEPIPNPQARPEICSDRHRYLVHQNQRISPAKFDEKVRAIVREELKVALAEGALGRAHAELGVGTPHI
jgi:hypothetical protein